MSSKIEIKNKIQSEAVELSKKHQFLCLNWATGTGKTLASAKIVESILKLNPKAKGYLVCKENTHKKNWKDEFIKHGKQNLLNNTKTILYASLHKESEKADFVLLDECHALTPKRISALKNILQKDVRIIFLSATIPVDKKELMIKLCKKIHFYKIDLNKAFDLGLLPEPKLIVHRFNLKKNIENKSWEYVWRKPKKGFKAVVKCNYKDLRVTIKKVNKMTGITCICSEQEYYNLATDQMKYYESLSMDYRNININVRRGCRNKYLNIATVRKRFIAEVKTSRVNDLVTKFRNNNNRFICFTGSVQQANLIGAKNAIHSKNKKEDNQNLVDCFNDNECSELFAVKMLREGVNLFNIEKGIITQLDSGIGSFFQMLGRCLRHEFPEMHLFVVNNTQDVKYFNNSMDNFNQKFIKYINYD